MKRIIMMLALAAFLVAALSVSALSAFAQGENGRGHERNFNEEVSGAEVVHAGKSDNIKSCAHGSSGQGAECR